MIILSVLILILALINPASAQSFRDVPGDHWAYDAINQLVNAGVIEGYPDGEYKGQRSMSRFEMAVIISRALDNIAEEQEALAEGLNRDQAQYVIEIVRALMEKNNNDDTISETQAAGVIELVEALTAEYKSELRVLGADFDVLAKDVDELEVEVSALDVPEDNIEFGVTVDTIFEAADYKEDLYAAMWLWADGDALDLTLPGDPADFTAFQADFDPTVDPADWEDADELPSEKRFWQEYGINIYGNIAGADFNLDLDTISNIFSEENSAFGYQENDQKDFLMDTALLNVSYDGELFNTLTAGDMEDYKLGRYFVDEEDIEGIEVNTDYYDLDWRFLTAGFGADDTDDLYAVSVEKELDFADSAVSIYQVRGTPGRITNISLALKNIVLTEEAGLNTEIVYNDSEDNDDLLFNLNGNYEAADDLNISAGFETVGEDFYAYKDDLEEAADYDMYKIGAEYLLNEKNTLAGSYRLVRIGEFIKSAENYGDEDKNIFELSLENETGAFTNKAALEYTLNDDYTDGYETRVIELGSKYAVSEKTTLAAALVNKDKDNDGSNVINYNYLKGNMTMQLTDTLSWDNEAKYILGEVGASDLEGESSSLTTSLSVEF